MEMTATSAPTAATAPTTAAAYEMKAFSEQSLLFDKTLSENKNNKSLSGVSFNSVQWFFWCSFEGSFDGWLEEGREMIHYYSIKSEANDKNTIISIRMKLSLNWKDKVRRGLRTHIPKVEASNKRMLCWYLTYTAHSGRYKWNYTEWMLLTQSNEMTNSFLRHIFLSLWIRIWAKEI